MGKRRVDFTDGYDGMRVELQADRMPGETEAMAFTDSYKQCNAWVE